MSKCEFCENPTHEDLPFCLTCREKIKSMWGGMDREMDGYNVRSRNERCRKSWETGKEYEERLARLEENK